MDQIMSKTQFRPKVETEPYNSKLTNCFLLKCFFNEFLPVMTKQNYSSLQCHIILQKSF